MFDRFSRGRGGFEEGWRKAGGLLEEHWRTGGGSEEGTRRIGKDWRERLEEDVSINVR